MPRAKKTEEKVLSAQNVAEKKPAAKKTTTRKTAAKVELFIEHNGVQVSVDELIKNVKATYAAKGGSDKMKSLKIYVKPVENTAYFVVDDEHQDKMDVFFCD